MISKQIQRYKNVSNRANILKKKFCSFATYRFHYQSNIQKQLKNTNRYDKDNLFNGNAAGAQRSGSYGFRRTAVSPQSSAHTDGGQEG